MASTSSASETGCPWKLPPETMRSVVGEDQRVVGGRVDLDGRARVAAKRGRRAPRRAPAACSGASRGPGPWRSRRGSRRSPSRRRSVRRFSATATWPGWGRTAWMGARKGRWLPRRPSRVIAPARSAVSASASRAEERERADGAHGLGAVDQGEALLGLEHHRLEARAGQRGAPGEALVAHEGLALADEHERQVGQRSEDRPRRRRCPRSGTTGMTPRFSMSSAELERAGRMPEWPLREHVARGAGAAPAPRAPAGACRHRRRARAGGCAGGSRRSFRSMRTSASVPKPVLMPYVAASPAATRSTSARERSTRARASGASATWQSPRATSRISSKLSVSPSRSNRRSVMGGGRYPEPRLSV